MSHSCRAAKKVVGLPPLPRRLRPRKQPNTTWRTYRRRHDMLRDLCDPRGKVDDEADGKVVILYTTCKLSNPVLRSDD